MRKKNTNKHTHEFVLWWRSSATHHFKSMTTFETFIWPHQSSMRTQRTKRTIERRREHPHESIGARNTARWQQRKNVTKPNTIHTFRQCCLMLPVLVITKRKTSATHTYTASNKTMYVATVCDVHFLSVFAQLCFVHGFRDVSSSMCSLINGT